MSQPMSREAVGATWGPGLWRPAIRLALLQKDATWRVIDNGKTGGQNAATSAVERIHTTSNQVSLSLALRFRRLLASPLESWQELHQCTDDMRRAFRQLPIQNNRLRFCVVALWVPAASSWQFCQLWSMPFGFKGALLDFNRVSGALVAISRWWLGIPTLGLLRRFQAQRAPSVRPISLQRVPNSPPMVGLRA